jgi:uncharacterized protein with NRDE domain
MCVIAFAWDWHPRWQLLLIGNRDEFHARPSAPLASWDEAPEVLAGRDLVAGGTWMGVSTRGRACVVTNVRDPRASRSGESRGLIAADYLRNHAPAGVHAEMLSSRQVRYRPFNLLAFDAAEAHFSSNHPAVRAQPIPAGLHGLSNGDLDAPWPKVLKLKTELLAWKKAGGEHDFEPLFRALADETPATDADLPDTGVGIEFERYLSPAFIRGESYGTRASTVIAIGLDGTGSIIERRFGPLAVKEGETRLEFRLV